MKSVDAIKILQQLQNIALQKGLFADVNSVNQVSIAIATLQTLIPATNE